MGVVKDFAIQQIPFALVLSSTFDFVEFHEGWCITYEESTDSRFAFSFVEASFDKIVVCPAGVVYPGDVAPGNGSKRVIINFVGGATVTMTYVEKVDYGGWFVIQKGDFVVAYSQRILFSVVVQPI